MYWITDPNDSSKNINLTGMISNAWATGGAEHTWNDHVFSFNLVNVMYPLLKAITSIPGGAQANPSIMWGSLPSDSNELIEEDNKDYDPRVAIILNNRAYTKNGTNSFKTFWTAFKNIAKRAIK